MNKMLLPGIATGRLIVYLQLIFFKPAFQKKKSTSQNVLNTADVSKTNDAYLNILTVQYLHSALYWRRQLKFT